MCFIAGALTAFSSSKAPNSSNVEVLESVSIVPGCVVDDPSLTDIPYVCDVGPLWSVAIKNEGSANFQVYITDADTYAYITSYTVYAGLGETYFGSGSGSIRVWVNDPNAQGWILICNRQ
ncbi:MAG: hypothetical protein LBG52_05305 [Candidatus Peribacteria bacterium]|nr:hypothetical protein [Candidatus Peribacteria bacterium]